PRKKAVLCCPVPHIDSSKRRSRPVPWCSGWWSFEASSFLNKSQCFLFICHEVCAAMSSDNDCAACISHAHCFVPVPAFEIAVQQSAGKRITRAKNVVHLNRETGHIQGRSSS